MSTKIPAFIGYDPVNDEMFDKDGNIISKSNIWPDAVIGEKKLMNYKLSTRDDDNNLIDYEEIPVGTTFEAAVDDDFSNPDYESFGNDVADWTNTVGSEYAYQTAIAAEPYQVVEYDSTVILLTRGTAGSLASGEWDYVGTTVTVRLSDDTNPSSKAENFLQYVVSEYTPLFIFEDSTGFNATDTWYDYDTQSFRDPDPQKGELTFVINANTEDFKDRLENASKNEDTNLQISLFETGTGEFSRMFVINFVCKNRYLKNPLSLEVVGANVYTKAEIDALLTAKVDVDITGYTVLSGLLDSHYLYIYDGSQGRYVTADKIKSYIGSTMTYKTEISGTGVVNMRTDAQFDSSFTIGEMFRIGSGVTGLTDGTNTTNIDDGGFIVINTTVAKTSIDIITDVDFYNVYDKTPTYDSVVLDPTASITGQITGRSYWDSTCGCRVTDTEFTGVRLNDGQELFTPKVYNDSGSQIDDGFVVYITGVDTSRPTIDLAQPSEYSKSRIIGVSTMDIADTSEGFVTRFGLVRDIDTSGISTGVVYLDDDGAMTNTVPTGGNFVVRIGYCLVSNATTGLLFVDPSIGEYTAEVNDITGWPSDMYTKFTYGWDDGTRTFTLTPTSDIYFYEKGTKYIKTSAAGAETLVIADTEGTHWIYYNAGTLTEAVNPTSGQLQAIIRTYTIVTNLYWDATNSTAIYGVTEEWHGIGNGEGMPCNTHAYLHFIFGAQYLSGLGLSGFTIGAGSLNAHAQFGMDSGYAQDEDLTYEIDAIGSTVGMPIYYRDASNYWRLASNAGYSFPVGATPLMQYNEIGVGLTEITSGRYGVMVIGVINAYTSGNKYFAVTGTSEFLTISDAETGASDLAGSLTRSNLPFEEAIIVGAVVFQTKTSFANTPQTIVVQVNGANYIDFRSSAVSGTAALSDHNALSGRSETNSHPDSAISLNTTPTTNLLGDSSVEDLSTFVDAGVWNNISFDSASTQTIATGSFTPDQSSIILRGEGNTDDDLVTITATTSQWFMCYVGGAENITVKHGTGNIYCPNGEDFVIPQNAKVSFWYDGSFWRTSGGSGSGGMSWSKITTDTNAIKDNGYLIDGSSNTVDLTLPSSPSAGDKVGYKVTDDTNTVTIDRNGQPIEGLTSNLTPKAGSSVQLTYQDATLGWTGVYNVEQTAYSNSFTDATLSSGILTITHNLNQKYPIVDIFNDSDKKILPDDVTGTSTSVTTVDLTSFGTLTGTWNYTVIKAGGSGTTGVGATSPLTTKGDLWVFDTDDNRLPVGTNDYLLIPDSAESTGLKYIGNRALYQDFSIPAQACNARETNGAEDYTEELTTNDTMKVGFAFDKTTSEAIQIKWTLPEEWDLGTLRFKFKWTSAETSGTGTVTWGARCKAVSNDDSLDGTWGTGQTVTDTFIATNDEHTTSSTSALTVGGTPISGDAVIFEFYRDISDTYDQDALLTEILVQYKTGTSLLTEWS